MRKIVLVGRRLRQALLCSLAAAAFVSVQAQPTNPVSRTNAPAMPPPAPRRPSIVMILADGLGYGDLGCYGQTQVKTPNLDQLASEGLRFTSFYAGSSSSAPSFGSLMTGWHTGHAWVRGGSDLPLPPDGQTIAQILKQAGYYTGLVGQWGLGDQNSTGVPHKQGFDDFVGFLTRAHAEDYYTDHLWRYDPRTTTNGEVEIDFPENQGGKKGLYMQNMFTAAAGNFVRIHQPSRFNHYRPCFLCLSYTIPRANNEEARRTGNGMQVPNDGSFSDQPWRQPEKNRAAMITRLDLDIGTLMDKLKALKMDTNTVVIFTSLNGPSKEGGVDPKFFQSSGPFRGVKGDLYEGGIRVPLIVRWPAEVKPGQVSEPWAFWDLLPTAAEIARAEAPKAIDGISMLPTLLGKTQTNQHEFFYWETHEKGFQQAARMGEWKAVRRQAGAPLELYNLKTDPGEKENVAAANPKVVARLEEVLKTARTNSPLWPIEPAKAPSEKPEAKE